MMLRFNRDWRSVYYAQDIIVRVAILYNPHKMLTRAGKVCLVIRSYSVQNGIYKRSPTLIHQTYKLYILAYNCISCRLPIHQLIGSHTQTYKHFIRLMGKTLYILRKYLIHHTLRAYNTTYNMLDKTFFVL